MSSTEAGQSVISLEYAECLEAAASDLFTGTLGQSLEPMAGDGPATGQVIIAMISLVGDVDWSVFLAFNDRTATGIAMQFAGFEIPFEDEDMGDAIGELTNIYAGLVKSKLDAKGVKVEISLPNVVRGEDVQFLSQSSTKCRKWGYQSGLGPLWAGVVTSARGG